MPRPGVTAAGVRHLTVMLLMFITISGILAKPLESQGRRDSLHHKSPFSRRLRRSPRPLGIGYVSFDLAPHDEHHVPLLHSLHSLAAVPQASPPVPSSLAAVSAIKSTALHRGPSVAHGAVINLVSHEIIQTHDKPKDARSGDHVIVEHIPMLHPAPHAVSNTKKTSISTKVEHVLTDEKRIIPVVTHAISHTSEDVTHVQEDRVQLVPVLRHGAHEAHGEPVASARRAEPSHYRDYVGGYGVGQSYGGQGAGHGYYAAYG